jgi:hypothetical protein
MDRAARPIGWFYSNLISEERQARLMAPSSFDEIAHLVTETLVDVRPQTDQLRPKGWSRPVFILRLSADATDLFFNGAAGYRASFCISKTMGEAANSSMIHMLLPRLIKHSAALEGHSGDWVERSLRSQAAKTWIWEERLKLLGWPWVKPVYEINYPVWVNAAKSYLRDADMADLTGVARDRMDDRLSLWGVRAPRSDTIEIKGGWMKDGSPVPTTKLKRSGQIAEFGWT